MRTIYDSIQVENNKKIREYKVFYYKDEYETIDPSLILSLTLGIDSAKLNIDKEKFTSIDKLNNFLINTLSIGKISEPNRKSIINLINVFNSNEEYMGIEVILPYYEEPYENSDIKEVYDLFVDKLHINVVK